MTFKSDLKTAKLTIQSLHLVNLKHAKFVNSCLFVCLFLWVFLTAIFLKESFYRMVIIVKIHRYQNNIHIPWDKSVLFADQEGNAKDIFIFMNLFIVTFKICCIYAFCLLWLNKAEY